VRILGIYLNLEILTFDNSDALLPIISF